MNLVILRKYDAALLRGIRSYRALALTSVMSKWDASCIILRMERSREPEGWEQLHVCGMSDGISCSTSSIDDAAAANNIGSVRIIGGSTCGTVKREPRCIWPAWTSKRSSTWKSPKPIANNMGVQEVHGWITAASFT